MGAAQRQPTMLLPPAVRRSCATVLVARRWRAAAVHNVHIITRRRLGAPCSSTITTTRTLCSVTPSATSNADTQEEQKHGNVAPPFWSDDRIKVGEDYNRHLQLFPACLAGVAIGSYGAVPAVLSPLVLCAQGVVAPAPSDFVFGLLMPATSLMPMVAGVAAFTMGGLNIGHRRMALLFSVAYPTSVYVISAAAIHVHSFPAFVVSYGLLGGLSFFCGYPQLPPFISNTWFHDRKGFYLSVYFSAFGASLIVANPILQALVSHFRAPPVRLGGLEEVSITLGEHGESLAMVDDTLCEVVRATSADLMKSGFASTLEEGVFVLGTGSNGACEAMAAMGGGVFVVLQLAAWSYRLPASGRWKSPEPIIEENGTSATPKPGTHDITLSEARRTPNFYLLLAGSTGVCMAGLPFLQVGKIMVNDMFYTALGAQTALIAAGFPVMNAYASMGGRLMWGPVSDSIGCAKTSVLFGASVGTLLLTPYATTFLDSDPDTALLLLRTSSFCSFAIFAGELLCSFLLPSLPLLLPPLLPPSSLLLLLLLLLVLVLSEALT
eukprot:COSAG01_NODE_7870_length_3014_cov_8.008233_3_plen_550_part_00